MPYFETAFVTILFIGIGVYFHPSDPLFIKNIVPILTIILIFITLFYGTRRGLLSLLLLSPIYYNYYHENMVLLFLTNLLIVLILGQFYHYWNLKYHKEKFSHSYKNDKLNELSNAFYTLKISHDILEKSYAIKPYSIRSSLKELKKFSFDKDTHYKDFLNLIENSFHVENAIVAISDKNGFKSISSTDDKSSLDLTDSLVQKSIELKESVYVSSSSFEDESKYLVVIPVINSSNNIVALLAIDKIPFSDFNQDNIISISILLSYFMDQVNIYNNQSNDNKEFSDKNNFIYEFNRVYELKKEYSIDSTMIVFKSTNTLVTKQIEDSIKRELRSLDKYLFTKVGKKDVFLILLPITPKESSEYIIKKISSKYNMGKDMYEVMSFGIEQRDIIHEYAGK